MFLLFVIFLPCGVNAVESYIFELIPNIEYYDGIIVPSVGSCFIYEGVVPDGDYLIKAEINDDGLIMFLSSDSPVHLSFGSNQIYYDVCFSVNMNGEVASSLCRVGSWGGDGFSIVTIEDLMNGGQLSEYLTYVELIPVVFSGQFHIFDYVSDVTLDGVLDEVVSLLPILLGSFVVFLGIRKGISFLFGILRGS